MHFQAVARGRIKSLQQAILHIPSFCHPIQWLAFFVEIQPVVKVAIIRLLVLSLESLKQLSANIVNYP